MGIKLGGINRHLSKIKKEVIAWLEWQTVKSGDAIERENYLIRRADEGLPAPECPEPYQLLLKLRRFDMSFYSGGYNNQPHILMLEFQMCMIAEDEHKQIVAANQRMKKAMNK